MSFPPVTGVLLAVWWFCWRWSPAKMSSPKIWECQRYLPWVFWILRIQDGNLYIQQGSSKIHRREVKVFFWNLENSSIYIRTFLPPRNGRWDGMIWGSVTWWMSTLQGPGWMTVTNMTNLFDLPLPLNLYRCKAAKSYAICLVTCHLDIYM